MSANEWDEPLRSLLARLPRTWHLDTWQVDSGVIWDIRLVRVLSDRRDLCLTIHCSVEELASVTADDVRTPSRWRKGWYAQVEEHRWRSYMPVHRYLREEGLAPYDGPKS